MGRIRHVADRNFTTAMRWFQVLSWSDVLTGLAGTSVWVVVLAGAGWLPFKKEGTTLH